MRLVKVKGKWYINRCNGFGIQGKESTCKELLDFCKAHQKDNHCDCPVVNPQLGNKLYGHEEDSCEIPDDVTMAFIRDFKPEVIE